MLPGHKKLQIVEAFQRRPFIVRKECICEVSFLLQFWSCMSAFPPASRFQHFSSIRREFGVSCNRRECYKVLSVRCSSFTVGVRHLVSRPFELSVGVPGGTGRGAGCWAGKRWLHLCFPGRAEPRPGSPSEPLPRFVAVLFVWAVFSCAQNGCALPKCCLQFALA